MKNNIIQSEMDIKGSKINVVKNWLRNKETICFLGIWKN